MTDQIPDWERVITDLGAEDVLLGQSDPDDDQEPHLAPTRNTRTRPSTLDLARAFDEPIGRITPTAFDRKDH